ncbi:hypothetical protein GCM10020221_00570 [Streptomyces thioluteus]|uniref:Aerobactin siderophore biosynthesis IucA/IucC-like C-terminal domain-containing protein n=1 Tax=Streptomyces thioluteus TaxID=66431 RepID=A0ABN3WCF1_STRTU
MADALAARYYGGSPHAFLDAYFTLLLDWHTTLFSYGVALEADGRNVSVVLDAPGGRTRLRLLYKDHGGPRVNAVRLAARLGGQAADLLGFADRRILAGHDGPVADLFAAVTVHLCAGTPPWSSGASPCCGRCATASPRPWTASPPAPPACCALRVLEAGLLPVQAPVTAVRSGAADAGKHYVNGPNYLRRAAP